MNLKAGPYPKKIVWKWEISPLIIIITSAAEDERIRSGMLVTVTTCMLVILLSYPWSPEKPQCLFPSGTFLRCKELEMALMGRRRCRLPQLTGVSDRCSCLCVTSSEVCRTQSYTATIDMCVQNHKQDANADDRALFLQSHARCLLARRLLPLLLEAPPPAIGGSSPCYWRLLPL